MTTTRDVSGNDWDDTDEIASEMPPAGSRRLLLGRAAGGLVLAASGHFLPEWLEETAAREGALGGGLGGRHGKNRRGRNQRTRRNRGDRKGNDKDQDKPRGRDFFDMRNMAIAVHNYRPTAVRVRGWQPSDCKSGCYAWEMPTVWDWKELPGRTSAQHSSTEFVSARTHVAVQIGDDRVVEGFNRIEGFPFAIIRTGGWGNAGGIGGRVDKSRIVGRSQHPGRRHQGHARRRHGGAHPVLGRHHIGIRQPGHVVLGRSPLVTIRRESDPCEHNVFIITVSNP